MANDISKWNNTSINLTIDPTGKRNFFALKHPLGKPLIPNPDQEHYFLAKLTSVIFSCCRPQSIVLRRRMVV
jgi:hypothetical protein